MKTLLIYWGKKGGGAKYTLEIIQELKNKNIDLHISVSNRCSLFSELMEFKYPYFLVNTYNTIFGFIFKTFFLRFTVNKLINYININSIDIVYSTMYHPWGWYIAKELKKNNIPYVMTVHDSTIHPGDGRFIHQQLLNLEIKNSTALIALSDHIKKFLVENFHNENTIVIPHGNFQYFKKLIPKEINNKKYLNIIFFGRIIKYKGLDLLIRAFPLIKENIPNVRLKIYGLGNVDNISKRIIDNDSDIFLYNEWIDESRISEIFSDADLLVLPYIESSQSGVIGIAHSAGVPVIITPHQGLIDQLANGGGLITKNISSSAIADSIIEIFSSRKLYKQQSLLAIKSTKITSWDLIALNIYNFLKSIYEDNKLL